jgi:hypothetical protein
MIVGIDVTRFASRLWIPLTIPRLRSFRFGPSIGEVLRERDRLDEQKYGSLWGQKQMLKLSNSTKCMCWEDKSSFI